MSAEAVRLVALAGLVVCLGVPFSSLRTGKTLNLIARNGPFIIGRAERPRVFWASNALLVLLASFNVWAMLNPGPWENIFKPH